MDRDQYRIAVLFDPAQPWAPWAPQARLEPQGARHPRRGLRHRATARPARRDVHDRRPRWRAASPSCRTALDNSGTTATSSVQAESVVMAKEHLVEQLRRRCATRSASAARAARSPSCRSPTPTPASTRASCRPAPSPTRGRPASSCSTARCCALLREPAAWAPGVVWDAAAIGRRRGPPQPRQLDRLRHASTGPTSACRPTAAPASRRSRSTTPQTNPGRRALLARRTTWSTSSARAGALERSSGARPRLRRHPARQRRRPVRPARAARRARSRRRSSSTSTPRSAALDIDFAAAAERVAGRPAALARRLPQRRDQRGQPPRPRGDHRPAAAPTRRLPRRLPDLGAARAARREHGHHDNHVIWVGQVPLMGDPATPTRRCSRWTAGSTAVEKDARDGPAGREDRRQPPEDVQDRCSQIPASSRSTCRLGGLRARARAVALRHAGDGRRREHRDRHEQLRAQAAAPHRLLPGHVHRRRSGSSCASAFPTGVCDWSRPASSSRARSRGRPTRTAPRAGDLRRPAARPGACRLGHRAGRAPRTRRSRR